MNSVFIDGMVVDLERIERVNRTLGYVPEVVKQRRDVALARSRNFVDRAVQSARTGRGADIPGLFPWTLRFVLGGLGAMRRQGSVLASYLLFHKRYARDLIELGYGDTMRRREDILKFLGYDPADIAHNESA